MKINKVLMLVLFALAGTIGAMQQEDDLKTKIWKAFRSNAWEQVETLINDSSEDLDPMLFTAAAAYGKLSIVQLLLDKGTSVNYVDPNGCTALMFAARSGYGQIVQLLLDRGAFVNLVSGSYKVFGASTYTVEGKTALMWAGSYCCAEGCKLIVDRLLQMPGKEQQDKIYLLLWHMRQSGFGRDIYYIMKPYLLQVIEEENRANPEHSIAFREIRKIKNESVKQNLLAKYTPIKNDNEVSHENK